MTPDILKYRQEYEQLLSSGMFFEFHPELSGKWPQDMEGYIKEREAIQKRNREQADAIYKANGSSLDEEKKKFLAIKPNYYRRTIKGVEIDVIDIIQAFGLNFLLGNVLKYCLRAGQKDGNSKEQDLKKAAENINRELNGHL